MLVQSSASRVLVRLYFAMQWAVICSQATTACALQPMFMTAVVVALPLLNSCLMEQEYNNRTKVSDKPRYVPGEHVAEALTVLRHLCRSLACVLNARERCTPADQLGVDPFQHVAHYHQRPNASTCIMHGLSAPGAGKIEHLCQPCCETNQHVHKCRAGYLVISSTLKGVPQTHLGQICLRQL